MERRSLLKTLVAAGIPGAGLSQWILPAGSGKEERSNLPAADVIEWNAHIFSPDLKKYPFHPKATYQPDVSGNPADPLAAYLDRMEQEGITRAVIVHPEPYGDDHALILDCLEREPEKLRGTSLFYPRDPESPAALKKLIQKQPLIVATRFHALKGNTKYFDSFAEEGVVNLWRQAYELDIVIELHIGPDYAAQAAKLMEEFTGSKVLIDHLAEPHLGTAVEYAEVLELARFPNCYMKLSGLNHFAQDAPLYASALPFTRRVIREFGPHRVVWGSGSPEIIDTHMAGYPESERNLVRGDNIRRLLNWK